MRSLENRQAVHRAKPAGRAAAGSANEHLSLNDRAKRRLQLAAALLRSAGMRFDGPRDGFYAALLQAVQNLPAAQRLRLKSHVDWVEAYELEEERASLARGPGVSHRR